MIENGKRYIISTDYWFYGPDGKNYRAAWGTCRVLKTEDAFGFIPSRPATNWFVQVGIGEGHILIAGCQVHYALRCEDRPLSMSNIVEYKDKATGFDVPVGGIYYAE